MNEKTNQDPLRILATKLDEMEAAISGNFKPATSSFDSAAIKKMDNKPSAGGALYASLIAIFRGASHS